MFSWRGVGSLSFDARVVVWLGFEADGGWEEICGAVSCACACVEDVNFDGKMGVIEDVWVYMKRM
jgi:hypothetical protein